MARSRARSRRGGKWNRYKLGVVVYSSEGEEEEKDVLGHGKAKEQQAVTWKEEKRKEEEAAKLKEQMEDRRREKERSVKGT